MSPEMLVAMVSVGSGVLLVLGGLVVGRASVGTADKQRKNMDQRIEELRQRLQETSEELGLAREAAAESLSLIHI